MKLKVLSEAELGRPGEAPIDLGLGKKPLPEEPEDLTPEEAEKDVGVSDEEAGIKPEDIGEPIDDIGLGDIEQEISTMEPVEPPSPPGWKEVKSADQRDITLKHPDGYTLRVRRVETATDKWFAQLVNDAGDVVEKGLVSAKDGNLRDIIKARADKILAISPKVAQKLAVSPMPEIERPEPVTPGAPGFSKPMGGGKSLETPEGTEATIDALGKELGIGGSEETGEEEIESPDEMEK